MSVAESYAIGPTEPPVRDLTIGQLLEEAVAHAPERLALIAGTADPAGRREWT
jgi:fatty-acyl-CoA synthase